MGVVSTLTVCQALAICLASGNLKVHVLPDGHTVATQAKLSPTKPNLATDSQDEEVVSHTESGYADFLNYSESLEPGHGKMLIDAVKCLWNSDAPDDVRIQAQQVGIEILKYYLDPDFTSAKKSSSVEADQIMKVLRWTEMYLSPVTAAKNGIHLSTDDLEWLNGGLLEAAQNVPSAYEGDMLWDDDDQQDLSLQFDEEFLKANGKGNKQATPSYGKGRTWPQATLKYCFAPDLKVPAKEAVKYAISQIEMTTTCVKFTNVGLAPGTRKCKNEPAVYVTSLDNGCWSHIGLIPVKRGSNKPSQQLNLQSPGCDTVGVAIHEFLHALGMVHEQARSDRNEYVRIAYDNMDNKYKKEFNTEPKADKARAYDIMSVMHYGVTTFSNNGKQTIEVLPKGYERYTTNSSEFHKFHVGNRIGMTQSDADQLADLYRKSAGGTCTSNEYVGDGSKSCKDILKDGEEYKDSYDRDCEAYSQMEGGCNQYESGTWCCKCGGGFQLHTWAKREEQ